MKISSLKMLALSFIILFSFSCTNDSESIEEEQQVENLELEAPIELLSYDYKGTIYDQESDIPEEILNRAHWVIDENKAYLFDTEEDGKKYLNTTQQRNSRLATVVLYENYNAKGRSAVFRSSFSGTGTQTGMRRFNLPFFLSNNTSSVRTSNPSYFQKRYLIRQNNTTIINVTFSQLDSPVNLPNWANDRGNNLIIVLGEPR